MEITNNEIWISAIKNIKKDAELTYNYGYPFDSDFEDHICKCGTKKCVGYILSDDDWPKLKKELKNKKILKAVRNKNIVNRQHYSNRYR